MSDLGEMDDVISEFIVESTEGLDQMEQDLMALEETPEDRDILSRVFRAIHTIKGTSGFLALSKLESVTHVGENLLTKLRDGTLRLMPDMATTLLELLDAVRRILSHLEAGEGEGEDDVAALVEALSRHASGEPTPAEPSEEGPPPPVIEEGHLVEEAPAATEETETLEEIAPAPAVEQTAAPVETSGAVADEGPPAAEPEAAPPTEPVAEEASSAPAETQVPAEKGQEATAAPPASGGGGKGAQDAKKHSVAESNLRVDVGLLDRLMTLVGELVLARNQILQTTAKEAQDSTFTAACQRLNLITSELQEGVMKTRMQPIGSVWNKLPRVVRDLAHSCGKKVRIDFDGKETELDKTLIEAIKDPLTHIVRNAVDHGIEAPDVRREAGKEEEGILSLRAYHEGGQVNVEISDDGKGIDAEKIKAKAVEKGVITSDQAARMGEREAANLIFLPGLSTAQKVTNVSGRGVGMDVVRTNIEKIGGTLDIITVKGRGTTLKIKIPLTLAIIPALVVECGNEKYAIPQVSLLELVRMDNEQARAGIEQVHGVPVYRLRGKLLPLVYLHELLNVESIIDDEENERALNIVILQADDRQFGLVVEGIYDTQEIVVKPLGQQLNAISVFAGATIMGDGTVSLILDVMGLAQGANVVGEATEKTFADSASNTVSRDWDGEVQTMLIARTQDDGRMAIPLTSVSRLEEVKRKEIETVAGQDVVQYRGQIMPIMHLSDVLPERRGFLRTTDGDECLQDPDVVQVVVCTRGERAIGIAVEQIMDIVEETPGQMRPGTREGVLGTTVIQERVTEVLDVEYVIGLLNPRLLDAVEEAFQSA